MDLTDKEPPQAEEFLLEIRNAKVRIGIDAPPSILIRLGEEKPPDPAGEREREAEGRHVNT